MADFLGFIPSVTESDYEGVVDECPNTNYPLRTVHDWSLRECAEYKAQIGEPGEQFGYQWRADESRSLPQETGGRPLMLRVRNQVHRLISKIIPEHKTR